MLWLVKHRHWKRCWALRLSLDEGLSWSAKYRQCLEGDRRCDSHTMLKSYCDSFIQMTFRKLVTGQKSCTCLWSIIMQLTVKCVHISFYQKFTNHLGTQFTAVSVYPTLKPNKASMYNKTHRCTTCSSFKGWMVDINLERETEWLTCLECGALKMCRDHTTECQSSTCKLERATAKNQNINKSQTLTL